MRRALAAASIVFVVAWMSPAVACACPSSGEGAHAHSHAGPAHDGHADDARAQTPDPPHGAECHGESGAVPHESPSEPICCEQGHDAPAVLATLPDTQKSSSTVLLPRAIVEIVVLPASSPEKAAFRWREPPLPPFAATRRPLLI